MSKEAIEGMIQAAGNDPDLQHQLDTAGGFAQVVEIGAQKGYQFTEAEVQAMVRERGIPIEESEDGELSEEALEAVAGGSWNWARLRIYW